MAQLLRIQGKMFHVPSLARVRLADTRFLGRPLLVLQDHNADVYHLTYGLNQWERATQDYKLVYTSMEKCKQVLKDVPLMLDDTKACMPS